MTHIFSKLHLFPTTVDEARTTTRTDKEREVDGKSGSEFSQVQLKIR